MSQKGLLKLNILGIESIYFTQQSQYSIQIYSNLSNHRLFLPSQYLKQFISLKKDQIQNSNNYQTKSAFYFPKVKAVDIKIWKTQQEEAKYGYFHLPVEKIYNFPDSLHQININCVWLDKNIQPDVNGISHPINEKQVAAKIKISLQYFPEPTSQLVFSPLGITLNRKNILKRNQDEEKLSNVRLTLSIRADNTVLESQPTLLNIKELQEQQHQLYRIKLPKQQKLTFQLQTLPAKFEIQLLSSWNENQKTLLGSFCVNPFQPINSLSYWFKEGQTISLVQLYGNNNNDDVKENVGSIELDTIYRVRRKK